MPLSQVHAGMHCTGYSVVRGTTISAFDVDVVDVIDSDPGTDGARIIVTASGPAVDSTGIGPGFSGSPIYCPDGNGVQRNIGAISESIGDYGGKTVLATPIELMLANSDNPPKPPNAKATVASARAGPRVRPRPARRSAASHTKGVKPLVGPITFTGLSSRLGQALERTGARIGRPVISVPAGPLGSFPPQTLVPGAAVSAGYSSGDLRIGAVGTVSYTDNGRVWAFGHPFESAGARNLLLQDAYVFKVVNDPNASLTGGSYKLAVAGHDVGTLTNDAATAIVGRLGALPQTTTVRAAATDQDTGAEAVHGDRGRRRDRRRHAHRLHPARRGRAARDRRGRGQRHAQLTRPPDRPHVHAHHVPRAAEASPRGSATAICRRRSSRPTPARSATPSPSAPRSTRSTRSA